MKPPKFQHILAWEEYVSRHLVMKLYLLAYVVVGRPPIECDEVKMGTVHTQYAS